MHLPLALIFTLYEPSVKACLTTKVSLATIYGNDTVWDTFIIRLFIVFSLVLDHVLREIPLILRLFIDTRFYIKVM